MRKEREKNHHAQKHDGARTGETLQRCGPIIYRCECCGGTMSVYRSRSYPSFLARKYRCGTCGRMRDRVEMRQEIML